ncbi:hypothetical protein DL95DRAFT_451881 [Leptodontidium sp. 2 PMI_412]|nr:hypothetical protein DL95DRAFT_451881 [Leptodontidium sp. 2 PMI_412]
MDPFAVTGLVLGIAPLIISAVENYEYTFQPFVTYRRYSREIDNFTTRLGAQKAIFNNQCQLLLSAAGGDAEYGDPSLDSILLDPNHVSRSSERLNSRLEALLGSSLSACESTLRLTQRSLKDVMQETKSFQEVIQQKGKRKGYFSHFRPRMKITFAKTRLNDIINELRSYNDDLRNLSCQVSKVNSRRLTKQSFRMSVISEFKTTQAASRKLHNLLHTRWTCQNNVRHAASLSLDAKVMTESKFPGIGFSLSLACVSQSSAPVGDAIWLNVESIAKTEDRSSSPSQHTKPTPEYWQPLASLSEALSEIGVVSSEHVLRSRGGINAESRVAIQSTGSGPAPSSIVSRDSILPTGTGISGRSGSITITEPANGAETISLPLRSMPVAPSPDTTVSNAALAPQIEKLCPYFRSQAEHSMAPSTMFVIDEGTSSFEFSVSRCKCPEGFVNETKSLRQILQDNANENRREAWQSKYQLARLLTLGVLRFQSTPWLRSGLSSGDIQFLKSEPHGGQQTQSIQFPYVQINISNDNHNQQNTDENRSHNILARNEFLFNLGVVLLELGYDAPLHSLQRPEDIKDGHGPTSTYTDFFTARRLSCAAARELDARYGRLAKKCLDCDFGVGDNLQTVELQDAIVTGILEELDLCIELDAQINSLLCA